ncbi:MAG: hypothetical protein ACXWF9_07780 [Solirubrobacterales bacterium]
MVVCEDDEPTREPLCSCWASGPLELPEIVLSGRASEADKLRGFGAGADDYLVKLTHCLSA